MPWKKLSRTSSHRWAMLRTMVTQLIEHERIVTTVAKAKEVRKLADRMVTLGKKGTTAVSSCISCWGNVHWLLLLVLGLLFLNYRVGQLLPDFSWSLSILIIAFFPGMGVHTILVCILLLHYCLTSSPPHCITAWDNMLKVNHCNPSATGQLHHRRQALAVVRDNEQVRKLFSVLAPRYQWV